MTIRQLSEKPPGKIEIDLSGHQGNAFFLICTASQLAEKVLGWKANKRKWLREEMMRHDYDYVLELFDELFGEFVILWRPDTHD